ncbi:MULTISPECIES: ABC transporter substrate-binding protein [unclassified Microbacterium]|uniref:ABC transporter substrate-binding protein n=1 Tax=unclassified Microbacterium TaxID=2609290 RepID=UPI000EAA0224|nr:MULTISPECIES: extracellular solute-binding protein [unclassified Microbacterium]MBT2484317.1 extracellular solute-binding protein [Microbacterium sp. ISL-108]RKN67232.1 extracellular solute-binding protein [Microbacterium sp. CGR2]
MAHNKHRALPVLALAAVGIVALSSCGAGTRTDNDNATTVSCDYTAPEGKTTVNVLAYNSSAIDPFTDTMVSSCSTDDVTLKHDPIDFGGQVTKTTATLAGETGTYDILETYGFVIPGLGEDEKLVPLNDLWDTYADDYGLGDISESMVEGMSYDGDIYAVPMQAQMYVMAYRTDVFEDLGLEVPTTFGEMIEAAEAIKEAGVMDYPIALPWLATSDVSTGFQAAMNSLGADFVTADGEVTLDTPEAKEAVEAMLSLKPYMDPQVTTFDQPKVQQQMFNGTAAMSIMFSGRMYDLTLESNSKLSDSFGFAGAPKVSDDAEYSYNRLSIDGWSIPFNTKLDHEMLFVMMASAVSEDASEASVPAAYPAREGMVTEENSPYGAAANDSIASVAPPVVSPYTADITNEIRPILVQVLNGSLAVDEGLAQMQAAGEKIAG